MLKMTMPNRRFATFALAALSCLPLVGCNDKQKAMQAEFDSVKLENQELRNRIDQQQQAMDNCENEKRNLQSQVSSVQSQPSGGYTNDTGRAGRGESTVLTVAGDALFAAGSATIKSEARGELNRIASQLNGKWSGHSIMVVGHTDSDPLKKSKAKWGSNENLSRARAQAVADYLAGRGVSSGRMTVEGRGAAEPKGDKKSSRRVEVIVLAMN